MLTTTASPQTVALLTELDKELDRTRRVVERLPEASFDWRPHPKSYSLGHLASHVVDIISWIEPTLVYPEFDITNEDQGPAPAATVAELLMRLQSAGEAARTTLAAATPHDLDAVWTLRCGDTVLVHQPRTEVLREHMFNHLIHHRAQLTVYLRLLEVPVPNVYGPTADEPEWAGSIAA